MIRASVSISIPNSNPRIAKIQIGEDCGFTLVFQCSPHIPYIQGVNAQDTAINLANAINVDCSDPTILSARTFNNIVASVFDKTLTLSFDIEEGCCGTAVKVYDDNDLEISLGTRGGVTIQCQAFPPGLDQIDCSQYPPNTHIYRFRFVNNGVVFGESGTDYRYVVDLITGLIPGCFDAVAQGVSYLNLLSPKAYNSELEFYNGWASALEQYIWANAYDGTVRHLGNGIMEVTTSILRLPNVCLGLGINCGYYGAVVSPTFGNETIVQGCCIPQPEVPPDSPVLDPPPSYNPPVLDPNAYKIKPFPCCPIITPGGILELYAIDRALYSHVCLDNNGVVQEVVTASNTWLKLCLNQTQTRLTIEESRGKEGVRYIHTVEATINTLSQEARNAFEHLAQRPLLLILKDGRGAYWLMGEWNPTRMREVKGTSGTWTGGGSGYTFKFIETNRFHLREVAKEFVEGDGMYRVPISTDGTENCSNIIPEGDKNLYPFLNCYLYDNRNFFLNN